MRRNKKLIVASFGAIFAQAFVNANAGSKLYICPDPQQDDLSQGDYEAIANWIEIKAVGNHGEGGSQTNILTYDTWDTDVMQKAKGMTDAGSPTIELARLPFDPGQNALNDAALTNLNYAFKMERNDAQTVNGTGTVIYNRGLVTGPTRPYGRNEDFDLEVYTLALNQREVVVKPTGAGTPPAMTAEPEITGIATVGNLLTVDSGTFTGTSTIEYQYQWFAAGVAIPGATAATYFLTAAEEGKLVSARVRASNAAGFAFGWTAAVGPIS